MFHTGAICAGKLPCKAQQQLSELAEAPCAFQIGGLMTTVFGCRTGIFNFGVQLMLGTMLLYALLATETDPLTYTIQVLASFLPLGTPPTIRTLQAFKRLIELSVSAAQPLSDNAREQTAAAFSDALKSVFVSSIKLAAFHALFTWLTFRYEAQNSIPASPPWESSLLPVMCLSRIASVVPCLHLTSQVSLQTQRTAGRAPAKRHMFSALI